MHTDHDEGCVQEGGQKGRGTLAKQLRGRRIFKINNINYSEPNI